METQIGVYTIRETTKIRTSFDFLIVNQDFFAVMKS